MNRPMSDDLSIPSPTYRVPRHSRGMDPATRRLALIAAGLGGSLLVIVGGWTFIGHRSATVPVVQADAGPVRVKPQNPGGMQVAGANEDILSGDTQNKTDKLAPPPEVPAPQALRAPPPPPPTAVPAALPAPVVAAPMTAPAKPAAVAEKRAPAVPERPVQAGAKGVLVQLAAVRSENAAKAEWERLSKRMPELLGPHRPAFSKTDREGQTLWRVRTGGFNDVAQATQFCQRVRAKGSGCSVADF